MSPQQSVFDRRRLTLQPNTPKQTYAYWDSYYNLIEWTVDYIIIFPVILRTTCSADFLEVLWRAPCLTHWFWVRTVGCQEYLWSKQSYSPYKPKDFRIGNRELWFCFGPIQRCLSNCVLIDSLLVQRTGVPVKRDLHLSSLLLVNERSSHGSAIFYSSCYDFETCFFITCDILGGFFASAQIIRCDIVIDKWFCGFGSKFWE